MRPLLASLVLILLTALAAGASDIPFQMRAPRPDVSAATLDLFDRGALDPQFDRVWVYFRDKDIFDSETCRVQVEAWATRLDPHAAARRAKVFLATPADFHDLPVPSGYTEAVEATGAKVVQTSRWLNAVSVNGSPECLERIAALPIVQMITPVRGYSGSRAWRGEAVQSSGSLRQGTDPFDYGPSRAQLDEISVIDAHIAGWSGNGVRIASFDTGFVHGATVFQDIVSEGRLLAQWDFINGDGETGNEVGDDESQHNHGTATWSAVGGFEDGSLVGPAYGASYLLAKTEDITSETPVEEDNWVAAAEWADLNGADIITSSLGYSDWYTYEDMDGDTAPITIAADIAVGRGIVVCNSAGNEGGEPWYYITAPADGHEVIAVGAVDEFNQIAGFSSHGPTYDGRIKPDVVARGVDTYCYYPSFGYLNVSGTSLACPLVAGAAALILEARPSWTPDMVREALRNTADTALAPDNDRGWGRIDVMAAIDTPVAVPVAASGLRPRLQVYPNPSVGRVHFRLAGVNGQASKTLTVYDASGRRVRRLSSTATRGDVIWDGRDEEGAAVATGIYLATLETGYWKATTKVVVQR